MSDSNWRGPANDADPPSGPGSGMPGGDELPPVQPPSAGMIVQLFLIPALIVGVIIGVYALFGRMAARELNWRQYLSQISSSNPQLRGRGALGLAEALDEDSRKGDAGQHLAANPEIAAVLCEQYARLVPVSSPSAGEIEDLEYLSKALGRMQTTEVIAPVLRSGITSDRQHDVRKHSLTGLAMLAGTAHAAGRSVTDPAWTTDLIAVSSDPEPLFRHQAAFGLGLLDTPGADHRLAVLLDDPDELTRVNAAIGLARKSDPRCLPVLHEVLAEGAAWKLDPAAVSSVEQETAYFERMVMLLNVVRAVGKLASVMDEPQRQKFLGELESLAAVSSDAVLKNDIMQAIQQLRVPSSQPNVNPQS